MIRPPPRSTLFPTRRSSDLALGETFDDLGMVVEGVEHIGGGLDRVVVAKVVDIQPIKKADRIRKVLVDIGDRKSTRLNSSHGYISYAVFCLKKKKKKRP